MIDFEKIEQLSHDEPKKIIERMVKLQEECGELAQEVLIEHKASGSLHKKSGVDGIRGESVDVIMVALSIFFKAGGTFNELENCIASKLEKWQKYQNLKSI